MDVLHAALYKGCNAVLVTLSIPFSAKGPDEVLKFFNVLQLSLAFPEGKFVFSTFQ
ncbi:hypothetical protein RHGRI_038231 [Rhododendron griersonianum]|uniref:Uncharacterized protein n=1 Tax=Rhododendron griersonianum TaxID=479676 RepID=A0AAV6HZ68_9ERIC|nr:hypothetical protein RHGRI_038231 [Rhododendron griersonianum]